jgi:hypothetical protein
LTLLNRLENETSLTAKVTQKITEQFSTAKLVSRTTDILNQVFATKNLHGEETLRSDPRL